MTREEATKIVKDIFVEGPNHCQVRLVDTFEKLGMLKLDEPISADCAYGRAYLLYGAERFKSADHMMRAFEAAGMQIIEK